MPQHKYVALIYDGQKHYVQYFDTENAFSSHLTQRQGSWGALYDMSGAHVVSISIPKTSLKTIAQRGTHD